jgi:hypothetical protein
MTEEFSFEALPEPVRRGVESLGWTKPMPVQARVVPLMRSGTDLIVKAQTGSGKTGAFGIPIVAAIDADTLGCQAIVLAPTRELAKQVATEIEAIGAPKGIRCLPIYGGVGYAQQLEGIDGGPPGDRGHAGPHPRPPRLGPAAPRQGAHARARRGRRDALARASGPTCARSPSTCPPTASRVLFSATIPRR